MTQAKDKKTDKAFAKTLVCLCCEFSWVQIVSYRVKRYICPSCYSVVILGDYHASETGPMCQKIEEKRESERCLGGLPSGDEESQEN